MTPKDRCYSGNSSSSHGLHCGGWRCYHPAGRTVQAPHLPFSDPPCSPLWHGGRAEGLHQARESENPGFLLRLWVGGGPRGHNSYCLNFLFCKTVPFRVLWLKRAGFSWGFLCLHPLAFPVASFFSTKYGYMRKKSPENSLLCHLLAMQTPCQPACSSFFRVLWLLCVGF